MRIFGFALLVWLVCLFCALYLESTGALPFERFFQRFIKDLTEGLLYFTKQKKPPALERYKEYETAPTIDKVWFDHKAIGTCDICGLSDCPVVKMSSGVTKCKWCAELDNITYHLRYNGTRRFLSEKNHRH